MLDSLTSISTIIGVIFTILGVRISYLTYKKQQNVSIFFQKISVLVVRGHNSLKKFIDSIASNHAGFILFLPISFVVGFYIPQVILPVGIIFSVRAFRKSAPTKFLGDIAYIAMATAFGLLGALTSGWMGRKDVYVDALDFLDIWYLLN